MASLLDYFKKAGPVLNSDPTIEAYCAALDKSYYDEKTGLFKENEKLLIYDFDGIADRILGNDRTLLTDLACYYKSNDKLQDKNVIDIINGHDGTSERDTRDMSTLGVVGRGFLFDPAHPDFITISKDLPNFPSALNINQAFSLRFVVKRNTTGTNRAIFSTMTAGTQTGILLIQGALNVVYLYFIDTNIAVNSWTFTGVTGLIDNDFVDIVITNGGTSTIGGVNLYTNKNVSGAGAALGSVTTIANGNLIVGDDPNGYVAPFSGVIDESSIWSGELTPAQVSNLYNDGDFTTYNYSNLLDYLAWQFKVYLWDKSTSSIAKLKMLKQSLKLRHKIGTPWAVKQAIELVAEANKSNFVVNPIVIAEGTGGAFANGAHIADGSINADSAYSPFRFDVDIPQTLVPGATQQALFTKAIESYQNVRSELNDLTFSLIPFGGNIILTNACGVYYKCYDNEADTDVLESIDNKTGTANVNTSTMSAPGIIGTALTVGPTKYFSCPIESVPGEILSINKKWAIDFWITGDAWLTAGNRIFNNFNATKYGIELMSTTYRRITMNLYSGGANRMIHTSSSYALPNDSNLHHIIITHDGTGFDGTKHYVDLVPKTWGSNPVGTLTSIDSGSPIYFGYDNYGSIASVTDFIIGEIGIWHDEMTLQMISDRYNAGVGLTY